MFQNAPENRIVASTSVFQLMVILQERFISAGAPGTTGSKTATSWATAVWRSMPMSTASPKPRNTPPSPHPVT